MIDTKSSRNNSEYWQSSLAMRIYLRVIYACCAFMYSILFLSWLGIPFLVQLIIGIIFAVFVLLFRVLFPDGFSKVGDAWSQASAQAQAELAEGNYDGVPKFLQKNLQYPSAEDVEAIGREEQIKSEQLKMYKEFLKEKKKKNK